MDIVANDADRVKRSKFDDNDWKLWQARLGWEKNLDRQYEHRMQREGTFWHDPALDGLSKDDRLWAIIQMGFKQVADTLESVGMKHHYEGFLSVGVTYGAKMRFMSRKFLDLKFPQLKDEDEIEIILDACANVCKDEDIRFFRARYGCVDRHLFDCVPGRRWLSDKAHNHGWFLDTTELYVPWDREIQDMEVKWGIPKADFDLLDSHKDFAVAVGGNGRVFLWPRDPDTKTPPCLRSAVLHNLPIVDVAVDWTRMRTYTAGQDNKICIYDVRKDETEATISAEKRIDEFFTSLDAEFSVSKLAAGTNYGLVKVADLERNQVVLSLQGHKDHVNVLRADWDGNQIVSNSWDCNVHIYDTRSAKLVRKLAGHTQVCEGLDVDFERQLALSSAFEFRFVLWDLSYGKPVKTYECPGHVPNQVRVDWNRMVAATAADDGTVKFWDLESGECTKTLDCKHKQTLALDVDWEKGLVLTGSWNYEVKLWDIKSGELLQQYLKPSRALSQVRLSP